MTRLPIAASLALSALCTLGGPGLTAAEHAHDAHAPALAPTAAPAASEATAAAFATAAAEAAHQAGHGEVKSVTPLEAIARLSGGNARFAAGRRQRSADPGSDAGIRMNTAGGQHPIAAVLTCADSRVPPELLFDQAVGDLFVVRNAGNVAEPIGEGSLEYAVEHLGVRLVVVMGHASCGAVKAVTGTQEVLPGHLADIQRQMPGLEAYAAGERKLGRDNTAVIAAAVRHNAIDQATALVRDSEALRRGLNDGTLAVVPAVYDLTSGLVEFLQPVAAAGSSNASPAGH